MLLHELLLLLLLHQKLLVLLVSKVRGVRAVASHGADAQPVAQVRLSHASKAAVSCAHDRSEG